MYAVGYRAHAYHLSSHQEVNCDLPSILITNSNPWGSNLPSLKFFEVCQTPAQLPNEKLSRRYSALQDGLTTLWGYSCLMLHNPYVCNTFYSYASRKDVWVRRHRWNYLFILINWLKGCIFKSVAVNVSPPWPTAYPRITIRFKYLKPTKLIYVHIGRETNKLAEPVCIYKLRIPP